MGWCPEVHDDVLGLVQEGYVRRVLLSANNITIHSPFDVIRRPLDRIVVIALE